jgi:carbamoylphosphate synthase large subunit
MPKRTDISSILVIGAGPIVIGQACEFDYSGTQAIKALKEEGYRIVLVNSNPATIMTDPELADATYVEPITPAIVAKIIEKERPDAILPTMGGQTALNTALALFHDGTLEKFGVTMIGADADAIDMAEDRLKFRDAMDRIGLESARSAIAHTVEEALEGLEKTGLPSIIRPSFTMGGSGGGIAYNREEFIAIVRGGLDLSPTTEVLIEESLLGWKEYEMEVVRDRNDNAIIICSIENVDPMGVHTGDSITVAPALTLTDKEYQIMRNASIAVLREIGVETGGSNVQFAVNPKDGRLVVIEMNPRVSRSSALASKATGFPIAKVAAKLAVGYTLDEIENDITGATPAAFEPTIDPAVRVREVQGRVEHARHRDEVGRRGDGDRPQHPRVDAKGFARARDGLVGLQPGRSSRRRAACGNRGGAGCCYAGPVAGGGAGAARGLHGRRGACDRQVRSVVPGADRRDHRGRGRGDEGRPADRRGGYAAAEEHGVQRQAARMAGAAIGEFARDEPRRGAWLGADPRGRQGDDRRRDRGRGARSSAQVGRAAGVQADRYLCGRIRREDAVYVFDVRGAELRRAGERVRADGS